MIIFIEEGFSICGLTASAMDVVTVGQVIASKKDASQYKLIRYSYHRLSTNICNA